VTTGATRGDQIAVLKGVNEGDMIVTSGQIKLHNGSTVLIDNSIMPTADAAPTVPIDR
jgi:membrane fusion protein, multidrug efflux system